MILEEPLLLPTPTARPTTPAHPSPPYRSRQQRSPTHSVTLSSAWGFQPVYPVGGGAKVVLPSGCPQTAGAARQAKQKFQDSALGASRLAEAWWEPQDRDCRKT